MSKIQLLAKEQFGLPYISAPILNPREDPHIECEMQVTPVRLTVLYCCLPV